MAKAVQLLNSSKMRPIWDRLSRSCALSILAWRSAPAGTRVEASVGVPVAQSSKTLASTVVSDPTCSISDLSARPRSTDVLGLKSIPARFAGVLS